MSQKKTGLGKGLGALLPTIEFSDSGFKIKVDDEEGQGNFAIIEISSIRNNPYQPRREFSEESLNELKYSILVNGIIQPISVRRTVTGYELISGERRLRAAQMAGLNKIPAYILEVESDIKMLELALIENLQREDLNPIEISNSYQRLIEECNLTQEELAGRMGKDRTTITNFLRLLKLPQVIQDSLRQKEITMGHARALLGLTNKQDILLLWKEIKQKNLSVRATESLVKDVQSGKIVLVENHKTSVIKRVPPKPVVNANVSAILKDNENQLRHIYKTKVQIIPKNEKSGTIVFEFFDSNEYERLLELFLSVENIKDKI